LLCSGRLRVASIEDFSIPETQRIKSSNDQLEDMKENAFAAGNCPYCGGKLVERQSQYGTFWGCKNYPHCRFTASADPNTGELIMKG
jgi:DNA topoisomerase-1